MKLKLCSIVLVALLAGCMTSGNPAVKDENVLSNIRKGHTTKSDMIRMLGEPQTKNVSKDGVESWVYSYVDMKVTGMTYVPIVGIFAGGANSDVNSVTVDFDLNDTVSKVSVGKGTVQTRNFGEGKTQMKNEER